MSTNTEFKENSDAVQAHLSISQSIIQRMAANSTTCKASCITLVSAILVLIADKGKPQFAYIALIPTMLFFAMDVYYLALEKMFRKSYNRFIQKLHHGKIIADDLYAMTPTGNLCKTMLLSTLSFSVWPFYIMLCAMIYIAQKLVM